MKGIKPFEGVSPAVVVWQQLGLWPEQNSKCSYYIYGILLHILFSYIYAIFMCAAIFFQMDNLKDSTEVIYVSVSEVTYMCKITGFLIYRRKIKKLIADMETLLYLNLNDENEIKLVSAGIKKGKWCMYIVWIIFVLAALMAGVKVFFSGDKATLPFPSSYPFDWNATKIIYWTVYIYQIIGILIQVSISAGIDTMPSSIMAMIGGYCDALGYSLEQINISPKYIAKNQKAFEIAARKYSNILKLV